MHCGLCYNRPSPPGFGEEVTGSGPSWARGSRWAGMYGLYSCRQAPMATAERERHCSSPPKNKVAVVHILKGNWLWHGVLAFIEGFTNFKPSQILTHFQITDPRVAQKMSGSVTPLFLSLLYFAVASQNNVGPANPGGPERNFRTVYKTLL